MKVGSVEIFIRVPYQFSWSISFLISFLFNFLLLGSSEGLWVKLSVEQVSTEVRRRSVQKGRVMRNSHSKSLLSSCFILFPTVWNFKVFLLIGVALQYINGELLHFRPQCEFPPPTGLYWQRFKSGIVVFSPSKVVKNVLQIFSLYFPII